MEGTFQSLLASLEGVFASVLGNPVILFPVLLIAAFVVYSLLKRLLKLAAILLIAGGLYLLLVDYVGGGL